MKNCKIVIEQIAMDKEDTNGLSVAVKGEEVSGLDKCLLLHALAQSLDMDSADIMLYCLSEMGGVFDNATESVRIPITESLKDLLK